MEKYEYIKQYVKEFKDDLAPVILYEVDPENDRYATRMVDRDKEQKMDFIIIGLAALAEIFYKLFCKGGWVLVPVLFVVGIIYMIVVKKYKKAVVLFVIMLLLLLGISQLDYRKSRKIVDTEWMIGKPVWLVQLRYSSKGKCKPIEYNGKVYNYCVREIYYQDWLDGYTDEIEYFVYEENEIITDVYEKDMLEFPKSSYDYADRWR